MFIPVAIAAGCAAKVKKEEAEEAATQLREEDTVLGTSVDGE